jgi:hypothetical protein
MKNLLLSMLVLASATAANAGIDSSNIVIETQEIAPRRVPGPYDQNNDRYDRYNDRYPNRKNTGIIPDEDLPFSDPGKPDRVEQAGRVIQASRDVVALGEAIYELINKGRPVINTSYEPISIVPRDPMSKEFIDPMDMENFRGPIVKNFRTRIKAFGMQEAVVFEYKVIYSYNGSYDGRGKYLTGVNIIPSRVVAKRGYTVNSSMMMSGMMNYGTRMDPIVGLMITVKYQIGNSGRVMERNDTFTIRGDNTDFRVN